MPGTIPLRATITLRSGSTVVRRICPTTVGVPSFAGWDRHLTLGRTVRSEVGGRVVSSIEKKRIGVLVVAYNAASTLAKVLDRIPHEVRPDIEEVIVSDDHSDDSTYLVGLGYQ